MEFSDCLMLSVKHNSIMAKAMDLIFSLLDIASAQKVSWHTTVCAMYSLGTYCGFYVH